jgi:cytidine deaminase
MTGIDWSLLREEAGRVRGSAYAPYSGFTVGAAGVAADGRLLTGCNVENASIGVTLCAECGLVSDLVAGGGGRLSAVSCLGGPAGGAGAAVLPCGRCRQLLAEHGGPDLLVDGPRGPVPLADLLPDAFTARDMVGEDAVGGEVER